MLSVLGGEEVHATVVNEMPSHVHNNNYYGNNTIPFSGSGGAYWGYYEGSNNGGSQPFLSSTGGSAAHNVRSPFLAFNYIVKV